MDQKLCNLATYQFDNYFHEDFHDEVYIMLRQFNFGFLKRVDQKLETVQHHFRFRLLNWEEIKFNVERIIYDAIPNS